MFPIYSSYYTGNSPFHHTVAALMAAGATVQSATIANNYWAQGIGSSQPYNPSTGESPIYITSPGNPRAAFECPEYGGCAAAGMMLNVPTGYAPANGSDHHGTIFDPTTLKGEVDGWGGYGCTAGTPAGQSVVPGQYGCAHPCDYEPLHSPSIIDCSFGGFSPFSGNGLGNGAVAAGYAAGIYTIVAQELLNGHIDHALAIGSSCLDNAGVYPAARATDTLCPSNIEPNAVYGDLIHLKSSVNVASYGASSYCTTILQALQTYGAYTDDTNESYGISLASEFAGGQALYALLDPWATTILPAMAQKGEAVNVGTTYTQYNCLKYVSASQIEVIVISKNLP